MTAATRSKIREADPLSEGGWFVGGVEDPVAALAAVADHCDWEDRVGIERDDAEALAEWAHNALATAMSGRWRKVHNLPGSEGEYDGCAWTLWPANPGRGATQGVCFE